MNILVCMKAVPEASAVQTGDQFQLMRDHAALRWNIADESALEAALQLKNADGCVTVLTMGPAKLEQALSGLFARGVDRAVLLTDRLLAGSDTYATAKALSAAVQRLGAFDLILCGHRAIDGETGQVPGMLAAALGIPCITDVETVLSPSACVRRLESGMQTLQFCAPALLTVCEYTYTLRLPGMMAMRKAKNKQVQLMQAQELHLQPQELGSKGSLTRVVRAAYTFPGQRKCRKETDPAVFCKLLSAICREVGS